MPLNNGFSHGKKRRRDDDPRPRRRFVWGDQLHRDFVSSVLDVGLKAAVPSLILGDVTSGGGDGSAHLSLELGHIEANLHKYKLFRTFFKQKQMERSSDEAGPDAADSSGDESMSELERLVATAAEQKKKVEAAKVCIGNHVALLDKSLSALASLQDELKALTAQRCRFRDILLSKVKAPVQSAVKAVRLTNGSESPYQQNSEAMTERVASRQTDHLVPGSATSGVAHESLPPASAAASSVSASSVSASSVAASVASLVPLRQERKAEVPWMDEASLVPFADAGAQMEAEMLANIDMHRQMTAHMDTQMALFEIAPADRSSSSPSPSCSSSSATVSLAAPPPSISITGVNDDPSMSHTFQGTREWGNLDEILEDQLFEFLKN